jgi:ABC-2 type transport system ATP-binding protein
MTTTHGKDHGMSEHPAIELQGLTKDYGRRRVVEDVSFSVHRGRIVGLLGPNGAGKSTTLRAIVGLVAPTAGVARISGVPFRQLAHPATHVGVQMDDFGFEAGLTARRHLEITRLMVGASPSRVDEVLDDVGLALDGHRRIATFSTGMTQRLGLATALLARPRTLILDEPANGLDPEGIRWLRGFLRTFARRGGAVLVSSHQLSEIQQTADDVVVLRRRVLFAGELDELLDAGGGSLEDTYFRLLDGRAVA